MSAAVKWKQVADCVWQEQTTLILIYYCRRTKLYWLSSRPAAEDCYQYLDEAKAAMEVAYQATLAHGVHAAAAG